MQLSPRVFGTAHLLTSFTAFAESEQIVQEALDRLLNSSKGVTTIIVAHRLRTVRNADLIAVVHDGRISELGTHESLMLTPNGYYKTLVERSQGDRLSNP